MTLAERARRRLLRLTRPLRRQHPQARWRSWSYPLGAATVYQGHHLGLQAELPAGTVSISVWLRGLDADPRCGGSVGWGAIRTMHHPRLHSSDREAQRRRESPSRLLRALPRLVDGFARELARGAPPSQQADEREAGLPEVASEPATEAEQDVYRAILRDLFRHVRARPLAVHPVAAPLDLSPARWRHLQSLEEWTGQIVLNAEPARLRPEGFGGVAWRRSAGFGKLYRRHPEVQGLLVLSRVAWSADGQRALVGVTNELGYGDSWPDALREAPLPQGPWSETVQMLAVLEQDSGFWTLRRHLDLRAPVPAEILAQALEEELSEAVRTAVPPPGVVSLLLRRVEFEERFGPRFRRPGSCELGLLRADGSIQGLRVATPRWIHERIVPPPPPLDGPGLSVSVVSGHDPTRYWIPDLPLAVVDELTPERLLEAAARLAT